MRLDSVKSRRGLICRARRGIAFRSLTEQMDTTTPQGEFLFHVFGALAQFERSLTQERVKAGLRCCPPPRAPWWPSSRDRHREAGRDCHGA
jgi:DNA invertase Pin-like site-specific DNA recombinase